MTRVKSRVLLAFAVVPIGLLLFALARGSPTSGLVEPAVTESLTEVEGRSGDPADPCTSASERSCLSNPASPVAPGFVVPWQEGQEGEEEYLTAVLEGLQKHIASSREDMESNVELLPLLMTEMAATLTARGEDLPAAFTSDDGGDLGPDYVLTTFGTSAGTRTFLWHKYEFPELYFVSSQKGKTEFAEFGDADVLGECAIARAERTLQSLLDDR